MFRVILEPRNTFPFCKKCVFILRDREQGRDRGREKDRLSSRLCADGGLDLTNCEIMTGAEFEGQTFNRLSHPGAPKKYVSLNAAVTLYPSSPQCPVLHHTFADAFSWAIHMGKLVGKNEVDIEHILRFFIYTMKFVPTTSKKELKDDISILFAFAITPLISNNVILFSQNEEIVQSLRDTLR